jgi:metallo-beta-lactamase class B
MRMERLARFVFPAMILAAAGTAALMAQAGKVWTAAELFTRNVGTKEDQDTAFPPHKIIGNLYYVGTRSLGTFLIVTPQGDILINSDYERTVPVIKSSVEKLGFKFTDIKILLGSHAHGDHMEGDALAQELSGAQAMAMAEDIPALQTMRTPSGKARPNYKVIHDGDKVTLGGTTLVAHLTPGHTRGCTTWTTTIEEGGKPYDVVIIGSVGVNQGTKLVNNPQVPQIAEEYQRSFRILRGLKCDVPLGSHPAMYNLAEKYPKLGKGPNPFGSSNPFVDPQGYKTELDIQETAFNAVLEEQKKAANERK